MSLIYKSLQKLQAREENPSFPGRTESERTEGSQRRVSPSAFLLGGFLLLTSLLLAGYGAFHQLSQPSSEPPGQAERQDPRASAVADNASLQHLSAFLSRQGSGQAPELGNGSEETDLSENKARLLHLSSELEGSRLRLGFEFDHKPEYDIASAGEGILRLTFPGAKLPQGDGWLENDQPAEAEISLRSARDPLQVQLESPRLQEHQVFTLPESETFGPRVVCALGLETAQQDEPTAREEERADQATGTEEQDLTDTDEPASASREPKERQERRGSEEETLQVADSREMKQTPSPPEAEDALSRARKLRQEGNIERAASLLQDTLRRNPGHSGARLLLARIMLQHNSEQEAASLLREGIRRDPQMVQMRTKYARILLSRQEYHSALQALQMESAPAVEESTGYYALLAYAQRKSGQYESAARTYSSLAQQKPEQGRWWMGLGLSLEGHDRPQRARRAYERALGASGLSEDLESFLRQRLQELEQE